ncbi:MAG TPA: glycosyltransferase [Thermoanaerobaculia bacterium]
MAASSSPVRLLWLLDTLGIGGAEGLAIPFARSLDRSRFQLYVACHGKFENSGVEHELRRLGVPLFEVGARNLRDRAAFRRLEDFVKREQIDVVHAHLTYSAIWSALLTRSTGIPSYASLHVAPAATREFKKTLLFRIATDLRDRVLRFVLNRWSNGVIAVSDALRQTYLEGGALRPEKVQVVHNGIELGRFQRDPAETRARLEREFDIPAGAPILVTVSVLRPAKGIEVLLETVQRVPGAYFLIVGGGPNEEVFRQLAVKHGAGARVRWAGFRTDVDALLAGCDLFVHPSLADAFPTVLLEAMAAGLPVIASRVGGIPEIVTPGVTGTLVPPGDAGALATAIAALLADRGAMARMSAAARERSQREFSAEAWLARLGELYEKVTR